MLISQTKVFEVDDNIAMHIKKLNDKGYLTEYSCSGHLGQALGYISFEIFTSKFLTKHEIEPPKNWLFSYFSMDERLGLYMNESTIKNFAQSEDFTEELLTERLNDLMIWIDDLPIKNVPYVLSINTEVTDGEYYKTI